MKVLQLHAYNKKTWSIHIHKLYTEILTEKSSKSNEGQDCENQEQLRHLFF